MFWNVVVNKKVLSPKQVIKWAILNPKITEGIISCEKMSKTKDSQTMQPFDITVYNRLLTLFGQHRVPMVYGVGSALEYYRVSTGEY